MSSSSTTPPPGANAKIYFSHRHPAYSGFTNSSDHAINYKGAVYKTADHLYHALKFLGSRPDIAELLQKAPDPQLVAKSHAEFQSQDWPGIHLDMMELVLRLKFHQYPGLETILRDTGNAELIQLGSDQYWSRQQENGTGRNEFGKLLMKVRSTLRR